MDAGVHPFTHELGAHGGDELDAAGHQSRPVSMSSARAGPSGVVRFTTSLVRRFVTAAPASSGQGHAPGARVAAACVPVTHERDARRSRCAARFVVCHCYAASEVRPRRFALCCRAVDDNLVDQTRFRASSAKVNTSQGGS
jgi:hypothetical protein